MRRKIENKRIDIKARKRNKGRKGKRNRGK
jgi:hypothetical protein